MFRCGVPGKGQGRPTIPGRHGSLEAVEYRRAGTAPASAGYHTMANRSAEAVWLLNNLENVSSSADRSALPAAPAAPAQPTLLEKVIQFIGADSTNSATALVCAGCAMVACAMFLA